jgi:hypothetical protein
MKLMAGPGMWCPQVIFVLPAGLIHYRDLVAEAQSRLQHSGEGCDDLMGAVPVRITEGNIPTTHKRCPTRKV